MTEQDWLTGIDPRPLLAFVGSSLARKLRLFAVACGRRLSDLYGHEEALLVAERLADGLTDNRARRKARKRAAHQQTAACVLAGDALEAATLILELLWQADTWRSWKKVGSRNVPDDAEWSNFSDVARVESGLASADLLRHIIGNPFRPYPAPPSWPLDVVHLAEAVYAGGDVGFALADALLEAGHPELAEHFRTEPWHPKGCWVVDAITGRK